MKNTQSNKTGLSVGESEHLEMIHNKLLRLKEINVELKIHMNYESKTIPDIFRTGTSKSIKR